MPGGLNGSAMIAASMRPACSDVSRFSVRFSSISSGISGARSLQRRNKVRQQVRRDRVDHAEPEQADQLVASRLRDVADAGRFLQHLLRLLDDALADRRYRHLALAALENLRAQLLLELLDRDRQRRLADEAMLRRPAEIAFLRDGDDIAQLVERHRSALRGTRRIAAPTSGCFSPSSTVASR